jgi:hypothetical protein
MLTYSGITIKYEYLKMNEEGKYLEVRKVDSRRNA